MFSQLFVNRGITLTSSLHYPLFGYNSSANLTAGQITVSMNSFHCSTANLHRCHDALIYVSTVTRHQRLSDMEFNLECCLKKHLVQWTRTHHQLLSFSCVFIWVYETTVYIEWSVNLIWMWMIDTVKSSPHQLWCSINAFMMGHLGIEHPHL